MPGWAFLQTSYYDDVLTAKPACDPDLQIVAVCDGVIVGVLDASLDEQGTIDTIAVHPTISGEVSPGDSSGSYTRGCAPSAPPSSTPGLAATPAPSTWYRRCGFTEQEKSRYLHVFASTLAEARTTCGGRPGLLPMGGFFHASLDDETALRRKFARVHVCRQLVKPL